MKMSCKIEASLKKYEPPQKNCFTDGFCSNISDKRKRNECRLQQYSIPFDLFS